MITTPLTNPLAAILNTPDAGLPASKDRTRERTDDFMNLLSSLCSAAITPQPQPLPSEAAPDCAAPIAIAGTPVIDQSGGLVLPAEGTTTAMPNTFTDTYLAPIPAAAMPSLKPDFASPVAPILEPSDSEPPIKIEPDKTKLPAFDATDQAAVSGQTRAEEPVLIQTATDAETPS